MSVVIGLSSAVAVALCIVAACFVNNRALRADKNSAAAPAGQRGGSAQYRQLQPTHDVPAETIEKESSSAPANEYAVYAHWPAIDPAEYLPSGLTLNRDKVRSLYCGVCSTRCVDSTR